jgi:cellulose synthase/poly-beta-1,6-N-acetylglucosamine synthase-like glycosyltransferase
VTLADISLPFEGLSPPWLTLFTIAFVVICAMLVWTAVLFVRGLAWRRAAHPPVDEVPAGWLFAFLVPALNEEITIRDSVERLLAIDVPQKVVLVVDDGSDDATPEVLAALEHPDLFVLRRDPPRAREGKAAALNHAYRALDRLARDRGLARELVVACVVDADGRLHPHAPHRAAVHFTDPKVGGVQTLVRIYNRGRLLTWLQDVEFSIFGVLFQAGRSAWGTAGMGGNGQFNRLAALDALVEGPGPWRDRLTEDQDLGLRLIAAGWKSRQELHTSVDQQGLGNLRRLYRQRTRWSQGNLQAMSQLAAVWRADLSFAARLDIVAYLLMPWWQAIVGVALVSAIALAATGHDSFWSDGPWWQLVFFYVLGFGGTIMGCVARGVGNGARGVLLGLLVAQVYAFYSWMLWPVLLRAGVRQLTRRRNWAKTQREAIA